MGFLSGLFRRKSSGINGLIDLNTQSAALSAGFAQTFTSHFNMMIHEMDDIGESESALKLYASVITKVRILNSVCSDRIEQVQNDIEKVAALSAACVVAQQRVLIAYAQMTSGNIYTSKLQAYVDSQLKGCNKQVMSVAQIARDLGLESYMIHQADSYCDLLGEERTKQYIVKRIEEVLLAKTM